jgi:hypothetical protein
MWGWKSMCSLLPCTKMWGWKSMSSLLPCTKMWQD